MDPATELADDDPGHDPYFAAADVGSAKRRTARAVDPERRRRQFRMRTLMLVIALVAVSLDPNVGPLVLGVLAAFAMTLGLMGAAMGLGLLGFGLSMAGGRVIGWLRRASRWPDE